MQVKSLFLLLHPDQVHLLNTKRSYDAIRKFWTFEFEERPSWKDILSLARDCKYNELGKALRGKFE